MATLGRAIAIAAQAHQEQRDKAGAPYILHPLRMMAQMRGEDERIVAVLHDLIEDTDWTLDQLRAEGFSGDVLAAIDCLTRRDDESYEAFIERARENELARKVKLADLEDNMDLRRIAEVTDKDLERLHKYHRARQVLLTTSEH
ncbi:MAG TPA: HD domain-containing protein [Herpetosiphonaceae bacterium]